MPAFIRGLFTTEFWIVLGALLLSAFITFGTLTVDKVTSILGAVAALLANALASHPSTWVLYAVVAVEASADGLQRPSLDSIVPRLVPHDQLAAASSLPA